MAHINLLPWRERLRKEQLQQFYAMLGAAAAVGVLIVLAVHMQFSAMIDHQNARNQYLEREIAELDKRIAEIRAIEETRRNLVERMKVIEDLQTSRPVMVRLFDEMVKTLPEGTYVTSLVQKGGSLDIDGKAESYARVSSYLQRLDASDWLSGSALKVIQTNVEAGYRVSNFSLNIKQVTPGAEEAGSAPAPAPARPTSARGGR